VGWWRIELKTGGPAKPGAAEDDGEVPHYLGDAPWDFIDEAIQELDRLLAGQPRISEREAKQLFQGKKLPARLARMAPDVRNALCHVVTELWSDLKWCYEDEWERAMLAFERECLLSYAVSHLTTPVEIPAEQLAELDTSSLKKVKAYLKQVRKELEEGGWVRIDDASGPIDVTSTGEFDQWVARRFPPASE
jgi:hypothetical protein